MLLFEARPGRSLISPFVAMRPWVQVLADDQRYGAIITPGGRVRIRRSGQSCPVAAGTRAPRGGHSVAASGLGYGRSSGWHGLFAAARSHRAGVFDGFAARSAQPLLMRYLTGLPRRQCQAGGSCRWASSAWPDGLMMTAPLASAAGGDGLRSVRGRAPRSRRVRHEAQPGRLTDPSARCRRRVRAWRAGERGADRLAQATAETDLVTPRLRIATGSGHILTAQEAAHHPVVAPGMTSLMVIPPSCGGLWLRAATWTGRAVITRCA